MSIEEEENEQGYRAETNSQNIWHIAISPAIPTPGKDLDR
jgi:hypothetical protein